MEKLSTMQKRRRFIMLRGQGVSYEKIAREIGSTKTTLIRWSRWFAVEIKNVKSMELDTLREEYLLDRKHRLKVMGTQLNNVVEELLDRDLSNVPTHRLFEIQTQLAKEIKAKLPKMEFDRKLMRGGPEDVKRVMDKTVSWEA